MLLDEYDLNNGLGTDTGLEGCATSPMSMRT